jgi:ABC-type molybdate transport system substrate-binding protein
MIVRLAILVLLLAWPGPATASDRMTIYADDAMRGAVQELAGRFERATIHRVTPTFLPSVQLAERIESGTHADLVLLAGPDAIDRLDRRGLLEGKTRTALVGRRVGSAAIVYELALVVSRDRAATRVLYDFLRAAEAGEVYRRHGFLTE